MTTGGCLYLYKSAWYLIYYKRRQGKWKCTYSEQEKKLEANNKTGEIVTLQYIQANEAMLMFGMYLAPDSNNKDQFKYIPKRETTWATSIRVWGI